MKFLKKAMSAFLASIMCIPAGIVNIASAEENDTNAVTTVTLSDTENGLMQFSEKCMEASTASQDAFHMVQVGEDGELNQIENDGSIWAFDAGDNVEIELIPDESYNVKSFTIKASDTGNVMAHKETMDNVFSFTMPDQNLTIEAEFSNSTIVEIVSGEELADGGELDIESKYHDITETTEVTREEVEETIFDLTTESYIKSHLNPEYMTLGDKIAPVDILNVKNTLFDGRYVEQDDTIDSIMYSIENDDENSEKNMQKVISQIGSIAYIYDFDENSNYYVAYANTMMKDENYTVQDWAFAYNDTSGTTFDGAVYDNETGLLYIPKDLYNQLNEKQGDDGVAILSLQVQFMQVFYDKESVDELEDLEVPEMKSDICTIDVDEEESAIDVDIDSQDIFALETTTTVSAGMDADNLNVAVNGTLIPKEVYEYDEKTGNLTIEMSSASIVSIEAWEGEKTVQDQLISLTAEDVHAFGTTYDGMASLGTVEINNKDKFKEIGKSADKKIMKLYGTLTYSNSASHATGNEPYYITADGPGNYINATNRLINFLKDNSYTVSQAKIHPSRIGKGADMYIGSNLSNYKKVNSGDTWIDKYKKFLKLIKIQSTCMHVNAPLGTSSASTKARFNVRIVKVSKTGPTTKTTTKNGIKRTEWKGSGYIVFGLLSQTICKQTTCNLLKVKFKGSGSTKQTVSDPFRLYMYKAVNDGVALARKDAGSAEFPYATLSGAQYRCDFYPNVEYTGAGSLPATKVPAKYSWLFTTKDPNKKGTEEFARYADLADEKYNKYGLADTAGIDFGPNNTKGMLAAREKWNNSFISASDKENWRKYFGKTGTYHIYEVAPPPGFINNGTMFPSGNEEKTSHKPATGLCVYIKEADDPSKIVLKINGKKVTTPTIMANNQPQEALISEEIPDTVQMWSDAEWSSSKTQDILSSKDTEEVHDRVCIKTANAEKAIYRVTTSLFDLDDEVYINVDWDSQPYSIITPSNPDEPDFGSAITNERTTKKASQGSKDVTPGSTISIDVTGTIPTAGLEGHTLVFLNSLQVIDEVNHKGEISDVFDAEVDDEDLDTDGLEGEDGETEENENDEDANDGEDTKSEGEWTGDEWAGDEVDEINDIWLESDAGEKTEQLTFRKLDEPFTSISSTQINRKIGGQSIAFAGKWEDETYQTSGDAILQSMTDRINYVNLEPNKEYTVSGYLVDAETGDVIKDSSGNSIKNKDNTVKQTTSATGSGEWEIVYEFDGTGLGGKTLVSFVEIYDGSNVAFEFKDKNDLDESFVIPEIETELVDADTKQNITAAGKSLLIDTISYKNLLTDTRYKIISKLIDLDTGDVGIDANGQPMEITTYKNITDANGSIDIELEFDIAPADKAKRYVAFEEIYIEKDRLDSGEWVLVAEHADPTDEKQQTVVPTIKSIASDQKTKDHLAYAEEYVNIYDTVHYEDLVVDREYILVSWLVDAETQEIVKDDNGVDQILETEFTADIDYDAGRYGTYGDILPENHDGNGIVFQLNAASCAGRTFVIYEFLYEKDGDEKGALIAQDNNPENPDQTIHLPKIWTNAIDVDTQTSISHSDGTSVIKDTISYENLIPGYTYKVKASCIL